MDFEIVEILETSVFTSARGASLMTYNTGIPDTGILESRDIGFMMTAVRVGGNAIGRDAALLDRSSFHLLSILRYKLSLTPEDGVTISLDTAHAIFRLQLPLQIPTARPAFTIQRRLCNL
jgi:hypothetical protein